ncbi:hypothetical protein [Herbiconiux sp. UC225_62]|uniref:hypothetical protein n=1 Tax=Herbiconiux sp. UC225_62 TaxID=3350168 RepID=UPI0036D373C8
MKANAPGVAVLVAITGCVLVALTGCADTEASGLEIDPTSLSCFVDDQAGAAVLQVPVAVDPELEFTPDILRVEFDHPKSLGLAGITLVDGEKPYGASSLPAEDVETMRASRDNGMLYLPLPDAGPATIVLLLEVQDGQDEGGFDSFRIFWGGGEPVYWQTVEVAAEVGAGCALNPSPGLSDGSVD